MDEEIMEYIVRELGRHRPENDIIFTLAQREDLNWDEARRLVQDVKFHQSSRVARRQSPLLLVVSVGTLIGGLALSGGVAFATLDGFIIFLPSLPIPYLGNLVYFLTGLAMVAGAVIGLYRLIREMMDR
jgi:hypothetical protein